MKPSLDTEIELKLEQMKKIDAFADMYDKFQSIVLDIAQMHDTILDRINSYKELDFKKVY